MSNLTCVPLNKLALAGEEPEVEWPAARQVETRGNLPRQIRHFFLADAARTGRSANAAAQVCDGA